MAKGKKGFLDLFRVKDDEEEYDEETDDLFDEEEDEEDESFFRRRSKKENAAEPPAEPAPRPQQYRPAPPQQQPRPAAYTPAPQPNYGARGSAFTGGAAPANNGAAKRSSRSESTGRGFGRMTDRGVDRNSSKLVSFDNQRDRKLNPASEVYVIKPQEFDDAQTVTDLLKGGKTIVINMEGLEIDPAQRIIDFIGGACYGLGGDLRAISASIFIAAPNNIEVSGDLRDEILNDSTLSPDLGKR